MDYHFKISGTLQTSGSEIINYVTGMKKSARPDGCTFENWGNHNPNSVWANTFQAHRLMYFVQQKLGTDVQESLNTL